MRVKTVIIFTISIVVCLVAAFATTLPQALSLRPVFAGVALFSFAVCLSLWLFTSGRSSEKRSDGTLALVPLNNPAKTEETPLSGGTYMYTESGGGNYQINIGFKSMSEMHDAHDFLCDLIKASPKSNIDYRCVLSCGCKSSYGGFPSEWDASDRDGSLAIASGVLCEKCFHAFEARPAPHN